MRRHQRFLGFLDIVQKEILNLINWFMYLVCLIHRKDIQCALYWVYTQFILMFYVSPPVFLYARQRTLSISRTKSFDYLSWHAFVSFWGRLSDFSAYLSFQLLCIVRSPKFKRPQDMLTWGNVSVQVSFWLGVSEMYIRVPFICLFRLCAAFVVAENNTKVDLWENVLEVHPLEYLSGTWHNSFCT